MEIAKKPWFLFTLILAIFIGLHLFGVGIPLHQDEYKWVLYSHPEILPPGTVPHPPLTELIYTKIGPLVGDYNFRFIPFFFGVLNFFLLFYLVRYLYNRKTAFIAISIYTFSFFALLSTLMVDVDGAVMPFFFQILLIGYFKWKDKDFSFDNTNYIYIILLLLGGIGGFFIKLSAVLSIGAVFLDFLLTKKAFGDKKKIIKYLSYGLGAFLFLVTLLLLSRYVFTFFNFQYSLKYWTHFISLDRGWFQTFIQCVKGILYSSPFLVLFPLLLKKEDFIKLRVFPLFLLNAFIFYILLFDFSIGALDRYLQLLIIPLTIMVSVVISEINFSSDRRSKELLFLGVITSLILVVLQSIPHYVPPLHPKSEWISRILSLKWNFLYPFSGGSGPIGFYVSFLFIAICWIVFTFGILLIFRKPYYRVRILAFLIPIGLFYNLMFTSEYLFGTYNGSSSKLVKQSMDYIKNNPDIKMVTTYNDNGGFELQWMGKYRKRLYIDPKFDLVDKVKTLNQYKEHYLVINVPRINQNTVYQKYFDSCVLLCDKYDKYISAKVYDCKNAPELKLND